MQKILIANRGEIAVRVMQTAKRLGYKTVAVYSEADAGALHTRRADEAVCIGAGPVGESYLVIDKIIEAAKATGADAVHPGYGFLSENTAFAAACDKAGITFIGPPSGAIELMGSKRQSKIAMLDAGVPCIPGYQGAEQDDKTLIKKAGEIGYPVMIKASAGGGGRGMRLAMSADEVAEQIKTARSEALNAFGSDELILEKAVMEPRHIEIQVFADTHGNIVHLGERDCSIQRRHQKVVEEAPSAFVDEDLRARMGSAAIEAARACNYRGAGTVEFLVDKNKDFYFLEMNTRLQVEHPVTEMVTGVDLVEWQLRVAEGEALPLAQDDIKITGHAVEVRLYAEDPRQDFMPQTGTVLHWQVPERDGIRVDAGIQTGQDISPFYDPMLAKVISHSGDRRTAIRQLATVLDDSALIGVNHNLAFLSAVLRTPAFVDGEATTAFLSQYFTDHVSMVGGAPGARAYMLAALVPCLLGNKNHSKTWSWRSTSGQQYQLKLQAEGDSKTVAVTHKEGIWRTECEEESAQFEILRCGDNSLTIKEKGKSRQLSFAHSGTQVFIADQTGHYIFKNITHEPAAKAGGNSDGKIKAPMDGAVIEVLVKDGDTVEAGQTLVMLEAMKMEHALKAAVSGIVSGLSVAAGDQVKTRQSLLSVTIADSEET